MPLNQTDKLKLAALCKEIRKLSICGDGKSPLPLWSRREGWSGPGGRGGVVRMMGVVWAGEVTNLDTNEDAVF